MRRQLLENRKLCKKRIDESWWATQNSKCLHTEQTNEGCCFIYFFSMLLFALQSLRFHRRQPELSYRVHLLHPYRHRRQRYIYKTGTQTQTVKRSELHGLVCVCDWQRVLIWRRIGEKSRPFFFALWEIFILQHFVCHRLRVLAINDTFYIFRVCIFLLKNLPYPPCHKTEPDK